MEKNKKSLKDYMKGKTLSGEQPNKIEIAPELNAKKIEESADSTAVFAFGRFNPPTVGHEKLIHKVKSVADEHNGQAHVFASHSEGTAKDPLPKDKKLGYLNKVAPKGVHVGSSSKEEPSFLHVAKKLHQAGHKHLVMVAGSDRVDEYKKKLAQYNGTHDKALYNFKSIKVVSAGERDPDAEGVEGMSGTKMRAHARAGEMKQFKSGLPKALHPHAEEIAKHIRSVKEGLEKELNEAVLTLAQRRKRAVLLRRRQPRIQRQKVIALKRFANEVALRRRSMNLARDLARARFAGKRGAGYDKLSPSDKIAVDKQIQGKQRLIKNLAARLYQRVRKREMIRISRVRAGLKPLRGKSKTGLIASSYEPLISTNLFESVFNKAICDSFSLDLKQLEVLKEKAKNFNLSLFKILDQFNEGKNKWTENNKNTPEQLGFNNVNSLIAKFRKEIEEDAASHLRQATAAQQKGEYVKADLHRKIASALARGDRTTARGYTDQLQNVKEEDTQEGKKEGLWANIHAKRARIKAGSGERMRKPGSKGAPTKQDFIDAQEKTSLEESFVVGQNGLGVMYTAADVGIKIKPGFEHHPDVLEVLENFMDGKNPEDKGDMARHGLKGMSIAQLKKIRSSETASPRKKQLAHWFINMHKGKD